MPGPAEPSAIETLLRVITALDEESRRRRVRSHKRRLKTRQVFLGAAFAAILVLLTLNATALGDVVHVFTSVFSFILGLAAGR